MTDCISLLVTQKEFSWVETFNNHSLNFCKLKNRKERFYTHAEAHKVVTWKALHALIFVYYFPQTVHCCSSSFQPLSETLGFTSCLFKGLLLIKLSLLWLAGRLTMFWLVRCFQHLLEVSASTPLDYANVSHVTCDITSLSEYQSDVYVHKNIWTHKRKETNWKSLRSPWKNIRLKK